MIKRYTKIKSIPFVLVSSLFLGAFNILLSFMIQTIIDHTLLQDRIEKIVLLLGILLGLAILYPLVYRYHIQSLQSMDLENREYILNRLIDKQLKMGLAEQENWKEADYLMLVNEDLQNYSNKLSRCYMPLLQHIITILVALIYGFYYSYKVSLAVLFFVATYHAINHFVLRKMVIKKEKYLENVSSSKQFLFHGIENIPVFRVFGLRTELKQKMQRYLQEEFRQKKSIVGVEILNYISGESMIQVIEFLVFLLGIYYNLKGEISFGVVVGLWNGLIGSILWSSVELPYIYQELSLALSSQKRIQSFLNSKEEKDTSNEIVSMNVQKISTSNLVYQFPKTEKQAKYLDMEFPNTGISLITGSSGAGKSTLAKLLAGLYHQTEGEIRKGNISVSYVPQNAEIFPLTIRENLMLGETKYSDEDIKNALEQVGLTQSFLSESRTLDSEISSDKVSGGEAQRIGIARAIMRGTPCIIMDEPFASLDAPTALDLIRTIKRLAVSHSFIIITHIFTEEFEEFKQYKVEKVIV